jgi:hypothetical protein
MILPPNDFAPKYRFAQNDFGNISCTQESVSGKIISGQNYFVFVELPVAASRVLFRIRGLTAPARGLSDSR